jgi:hypothetical protein
LKVKIFKIRNEISAKTRRSGKAFAVVSEEAARELSKSTHFSAAPMKMELGHLVYAGTLDKIAIYVSPYARTKVLVGAKGSSDADAGLIYAPYVPLMTSGMVVDPNTFEPHVSMMTRYGMLEADGNFYGVIDLS